MRYFFLIVSIIIFSSTIAQPPKDGREWELFWNDEFDGPALDETKWNPGYAWAQPNAHNDDQHTHWNHEAYCVPENLLFIDGELKIKGEDKYQYGKNYTAGAITSWGKFDFTYGYLEARLKIPEGNGYWPAFWTLNSDHTWPPEIDILEVLGSAPKKWMNNYHWGADYIDHHSSFGELEMEEEIHINYHVLAVDWTPDYMAFYIDGKKHREFTDKEAIAQSVDNYIIINLAIDPTTAGWGKKPDKTTVFPDYYCVDWVRVWKEKQPEMKVDVEATWDIRAFFTDFAITNVDNNLIQSIHEGTDNQIWMFEKADEGYFLKTKGGKYLTVDENNAVLKDKGAATAFKPTPAGDEAYALEAIGQNKVLTVQRSRFPQGANIVIEENKKGDNQKFKFGKK